MRDAVAHVIAELDAGRAARRREDRRRMDHAPVDQEGGAAVVPARRQRADAVAAGAGSARRSRSTTRCRPSSPASTTPTFAAAGVRVVPPAVARRGAYIAPQRRADAVVRQHRRLRRRGHDGRHLGDRRLVRADRQERAPVGRRRHRRRAGAAAGQPDDHRGQLLHRRALGGGRRRDRRGELGARAWACSSARARRSTTARPARSRYGRVPAGSVVVAGSLPVGRRQLHSLYCAVIVKQVDAKTRAKTSINELLRA